MCSVQGLYTLTLKTNHLEGICFAQQSRVFHIVDLVFSHIHCAIASRFWRIVYGSGLVLNHAYQEMLYKKDCSQWMMDPRLSKPHTSMWGMHDVNVNPS
jgi:hypothetical protein